ncbi:hypothetical protein MNV49_001691 [Pseudohyphozyma bogoriensis]|nr:hypothetical protein MNV49_001691 [Pseudohyphozyma bogoriensis]
MTDVQGKIASLHSRIAKERKILEGFQAMRTATTNSDVIRTCEAKMREAGRTIGWLEQNLNELQGRSASPASGSSAGGGRQLPPPPPPGAAYGGHLPPGAGMGAGSSSRGSMEKPQKAQYTNLDLIKADTPLTSAKISRMLHQLEFKLHVERQYKEGIDKMAKLYLVDGDKKARADTENKRVESNQKMVLLNQALRRYKTLDVMGDLGEEDDDIPEDVKTNLRKPLSGALQITIKSARDLAHAPQPKRSKHPSETVIYVKVEDTPRARTHPSRTDRWNEDFEIHVDKANEVEVTIYDKVPGEGAPVPIGMLWLRLSDVVEELRRKKMGAEAGPGWVTAARVNSHQGSGGGSGSGGMLPGGSSGGFGAMDLPVPGAGAAGQGGSTDGVDAWFAVEPEGAIALHLNFVKSNVRKRPYDAGGLGRQGAVRKRKEEIHEQNGHKFFQKQFYTVVLCALCGEFLLKGAGMQCEDCKYACHKNCYQKVVTKCISKSNAESDKDEDQLNHRIPHRFEPITNISPNWCCHCGLVLPLGRKNARKCSECNITAHADCVHLVPDFCGMSMEMANKLLADIKTINQSRKPGAGRPGAKPSTPRPIPERLQAEQEAYGGQRTPQEAYDRPTAEVAADVGRLSLSSGPGQSQQQQQAYPTPSTRPQPPQAYAPPVLIPTTQRQSSLPAGAGAGAASANANFRESTSTISSFGNDAYGGYSPVDQTRPAYPTQQQAPSQPTPQPPRQQPVPQPAYQQPPVQQQQVQQQQQPYAQRPLPPTSAPSYPSPYSQQQAPTQPSSAGAQYQQQAQPAYAPSQAQRPQPPYLPSPSAGPSYPQQQQQQQVGYPSQPQLQLQQQQQQAGRRPQPPRQRRIGLDDFNFLAVLGKGNFGKVMLAEEKRSSQLYAIKVLKKEFIIENDEVESTKSEKRVFLAAARERHPFLLGLHSCFQTETRIYFVMEYVSGGDLMLHIQREQFTPRRAKFYAAEVLLALEYFHQNGIVYRDLKLDNILLTLDGHVKVADYGLCKEEMWYGNTTSTFCGTPEFMAPEIILEQRYGRAVDWWAFGVLIYEMLLGQSPFRGDDEDEIFDAILEDEPLYPIHMPKDSVSILQKLLTRDPTRRLGSGDSDAAEIKSHLFFRDTNWDDIFHKRVPSPFFPSVSSATDTSNFDSEFTSEQPTLTPVHSTLSAQDQGEFAGFSWIAPWANDV